MSFAVKEWLLEDPLTSLTKFHDNCNLLQFHAHEEIERFKKDSFVVFVTESNILEHTVCSPSTLNAPSTREILYEVYDGLNPKIMEQVWNVDGSNDSKKSLYQLRQHLLALKHAVNNLGTLSVELIMETHEIMFRGAVGENDESFPAGIIRAHGCHATGHSYPSGTPEELKASLHRIVTKFNNSFKSHEENPNPENIAVVPATLFYDIVTLHPFSNGNGRIARLFYAWAVMKFGYPFPVILTSGHTKSRKHYMLAINDIRRTGNHKQINSFSLTSLVLSINNYLENRSYLKEE